ncbi:MAG: hypothetical protein ACM3UY_06680 [Methanocella sp.]
MPKYETYEVHLSELIKQYIANLPTSEGWEILAIDLFTDVLVLKRKVTEKEDKKASEQKSGSSNDWGNAEATQTSEALESQPNQK